MSNPNVLIIIFVIGTLIAIFIQVLLYRMRKRHRAEYRQLWADFERLIKTHNYNDIIETGTKLVYNNSLKSAHLNIIHKMAVELESKHPEFEKLKSDAYNKQLHYARELPWG